MKTIAVHDGHFHADDVFAAALLKLYHKDVKIIRTRDPDEIAKADIRVDIGRRDDPSTGDFDHHQKGGARDRENGIPYASFGLVWDSIGSSMVDSDEAFDYIDRTLVQPVDAGDNGIAVCEVKTVEPYDLHKIIEIFNPNWELDDRTGDREFMEAVGFASQIIRLEIDKANGIVKADKLVLEAIERSDGDVIVLDRFCPWERMAVQESEAKFLVHPGVNGQWYIYTVPIKVGSFKRRKLLPLDWGGLDNERLQETTGVKEALFCHRDLFVATADSKEGAMKLARLALDE